MRLPKKIKQIIEAAAPACRLALEAASLRYMESGEVTAFAEADKNALFQAIVIILGDIMKRRR